MERLGYLFAKFKTKIFRSQEPMIKYFRKGGAKIGSRCFICSNLDYCEKYMLEIGDDVTISTNVSFVTHDHSFYHVYPGHGDLLGKIVIGSNCFIGENSTILYGVKLAPRIIVAAGSVVTKSFNKSDIIIGGNPAKIIGTWESFLEKNKNNWFKTKQDLKAALENPNDKRFIERKND